MVKLELIQPVAFCSRRFAWTTLHSAPRRGRAAPLDFAIRPVGAALSVFRACARQEVQLERFSNYWNAELPYVDRLTIMFGMTADEIYDAFMRGELDYVSDLPLTYLNELKGRPGDIHVLEAVQLQTRMLVFDCERPPLSDRKVGSDLLCVNVSVLE